MKFSSTLSLALAGTTMAAGAADTVNQVLSDISSAIKGFDSAIKAYTGGDAKAVSDGASKIQTITESGAAKIASGADLTLNDAVSITTTVQSLQAVLDAALTGLEGIGTKLASAGQCGTISSSLTANGGAAQKLQDAITSKAPAETKVIAQQLGGKVGASIANTQSKFKEFCAGAPSGSSSSGGSSTGHTSGHSAGSSSGSSTGSSSGSTAAKPAAKPATSSAIPKPATYTGGAPQFSVSGMFVAAVAILAL